MITKLGRKFIGIEINPEYIKIAKKRISKIPKRVDRFIIQGKEV